VRVPTRKPGKYTFVKEDPHMTEGKFSELKKKLERLKKNQPKLAKEVATLAEMGDFSENFEYQNAKRRLRGTLSGIAKLEKRIAEAIIIKGNDDGIVALGSTVKFLMGENELEYTILGSSEADPTKGIISQHSPLAEALLGKKRGEKFEAEVNGKNFDFEILEVK